VSIVPGQVVTSGTQLTQVFKLDPIYLRMDFPQERLDDLYLGQEADVVLDSFPKETFHGKVLRISPQVNSALRVLPVVIELANPTNRIKTGISSYVRLKVRKKALTVPATALLQQEGKSMVFRVEEGRARIREVETARLAEMGSVEVRNGLTSGDEVVIFHAFYAYWGNLTGKNAYLQDNDRVDVDWRKWTRRQ